MIRTMIMLGFWALLLPFAALVGFPWTFVTGDVSLLYRFSMWGAFAGVRLAGVRVRTVGLDKLDTGRTYIFMSNHISNLDPPLMLPLIPRRTSVMAKKELFDIPLLGRAMRLGSLVPVDRKNREAGISAVRAAAEVLKKGISMTIYVEGGRSFDGKLLPFKKGPFYLAMECKVPVVPVTVVGTHRIMPKARFSIEAGDVEVIFHDVIEPETFSNRDHLMQLVRDSIESGLPPELRSHETQVRASSEDSATA